MYRWRYPLTYTLVAVIFIGILLLIGMVIPGGLSAREMTAVATSNILSWQNFTPEMIINLPYYALQRGIIEVFGLSILTVKLPTIIIAAFSGLGLVLLLSTWFKRNVAMLTALIAFTVGPFLLSAQSGSPGILYIFWPIWILYTATMVSRRPKYRFLWKTSLLVLTAGSLYTPLSLFVLLALISAVILHPHLRHIARQLNKVWLAGATCFGLIAAAPLIIGLVMQPSLIWRLLGVSRPIDIGESFQQLTAQYLSFTEPAAGIILTPVYSLPVLLLALLGLYRMFRVRYTARSYTLFAWIVLLIPTLYINPQLVSVTFVPAVLLIGYGIDFIIRSWYRLFPRNPYARVTGLIPIAILMVTLAISGVDRFVYGYLYSATPPHSFSKDLSLLHTSLRSSEAQSTVLVVSEAEKKFYEAVQTHTPHLKISSVVVGQTVDAIGTGQDTIMTHAAHQRLAAAPIPTTIITDGASVDADRFYLYKSSAQ